MYGLHHFFCVSFCSETHTAPAEEVGKAWQMEPTEVSSLSGSGWRESLWKQAFFRLSYRGFEVRVQSFLLICGGEFCGGKNTHFVDIWISLQARNFKLWATDYLNQNHLLYFKKVNADSHITPWIYCHLLLGPRNPYLSKPSRRIYCTEMFGNNCCRQFSDVRTECQTVRRIC